MYEEVRLCQFLQCLFISNPFYPKSDQQLISPYSNTAESFIKITGIKEMITNLKGFDC